MARAGGPLIGIIEHTAPDEAADTLGPYRRGGGQYGRGPLASGAARPDETIAGPADIDPAGTVIDAPFRWDDSPDPARWSVAVSAAGHDIVMRQSHHGAVLLPSIGSWRVTVDEARSAPALTEALSDL